MKRLTNKLRILKLIFLLSLICLLFNQCSKKSENKNISMNQQMHAKVNNKKTSIINIIANPQKHNGKLVQVKGFIHVEVENSAIYITEEDYNYGITKNSIWLEISRDEINKFDKNDKYVVIEGFFDMKNEGNEGNYSGSLTNITKLNVIKPLRITKEVLEIPKK